MQNHKATEHRLGIARDALKRITKHTPDRWDDDFDYICDLKHFAEYALKQMETEVNKKARQREEARDRWVSRLAQEVKETVDP